MYVCTTSTYTTYLRNVNKITTFPKRLPGRADQSCLSGPCSCARATSSLHIMHPLYAAVGDWPGWSATVNTEIDSTGVGRKTASLAADGFQTGKSVSNT